MTARRPQQATGRRALLALAALAAALPGTAVAGCGGSQPAPPPPARMTIHVSSDGRGDYPTLEEAVRRAPPEATVFLGAGTFRLSQPLDIFRSLSLVGAGRERTFVTCAADGRVVGFSGHGTLVAQGVTFSHSGASTGPGAADVVVVLGGRVGFDRCDFVGGRRAPGLAAAGAGLRLAGDAIGTVERCRATGNAGPGFLVEQQARPVFVASTARGNGGGRLAQIVAPGPTARAEFDRFVEPIVLRLMTDRHIPGAVVVLVRGPRVVSSRAWGYADAAAGTPMDAATTRLRVASLAKVVTATAVMQLAERHRLDLDDDVASYVPGVSLPATYPGPVTVGDLLTHSSGLDDRVVGTAARDPRAAVPTGEYLKRHPASRIAPPGEVFSYSNWGMALAGVVAERASGQPLSLYADEHIFAPLAMTSSSFTSPAADDPDLAVGYRFDGHRFETIPYDYVNEPPSFGLVTTGADMGRFMMALLDGGRLGDARILAPGTAATMQTTQFGGGGLDGVTYGFRERTANGLRTLQHTGDWGGFASMLFLMPEERVGLFVCSTSDDATFREEVVGLFLDHYYPQTLRLGPAPESPGFAARASGFTGTYRATRYSHDTFEKIYEFTPTNEVQVDAAGDALAIRGVRSVEIEPLLFRSREADEYVSFVEAPGGGVAYLFEDAEAYERLHWYETYVFHRRLLIVVIAVLGASLVIWPGGALLRRLAGRRGGELQERRPGGGPRLTGAARPLAAVVAALDLGFLAGLAVALTTVDVVYGVPGWLVVLLVVPIVSTALTAPMPVLCVLVWARGERGIDFRLRLTATTLAAAAFVWFLVYWNLLGLKL